MANQNVRVRYRPVRIGWCIRDKNWDDLRRALRLTNIFWGGRFNPIIPVGASSAEELVRRFRVDVLVNIIDDPKVKSFLNTFSHLAWPVLLDSSLFNAFSSPNFLDITHPLHRLAIAEPQAERIFAQYSTQLTLFRWLETDPLADMLLATFGRYPDPNEIGTNYVQFIKDTLGTADEWIKDNETIPSDLLDRRTISDLSAMDLNWDRVPHSDTMGFYVGQINDFEDLVNYWNLRACDLEVLFLDPAYSERLKLLKSSHLEFIRERQTSPSKNHVVVWGRSQELIQKALPDELPPSYWAINGTHVIQGNFRPPLHYFVQKSVLASLSEEYGKLTLAFQLPEKPFLSDDDHSHQGFVISTKPSFFEKNEARTFWTPYIPELNEWYGREIIFSASSVRTEVDGTGFISEIVTESLTINSIQKQELATKLFQLAGISAQPSVPGKIASRLIAQLGGMQGCRVLKIAGVRKLIKKYGPLQHFGRTEALSVIGNVDSTTRKPQFGDYEGLYIEQRDPSIKRLTPEHVFAYLLEKEVFRAGLGLVCPICELSFWVSLDDVSTHVSCELCGGSFNVMRQLKDRDWKYRRSGLFGQGNNQEGSIPVALTLQQLDTHIGKSFNRCLFITNMLLESVDKKIQQCETDLFIAVERGERIDVAIGECKDAGGKIELDDALKLAAVADCFPRRYFDPYIVFSKTGTFTPEEIRNCQAAQMNGGLRVIMLSDRELEPYFIYERTAKQFDIHPSAISMSDMARTTHGVFFAPKTKK